MKALEMLIIRACKSKYPKLRLQSIYRRYYCDDIKDTNLLHMMFGVIDTHFPMLPSQVIMLTQPDYFFKEETWSEKALRGLVNRIRFERVDLCPKEMVWPKHYRTVVENKDEIPS